VLLIGQARHTHGFKEGGESAKQSIVELKREKEEPLMRRIVCAIAMLAPGLVMTSVVIAPANSLVLFATDSGCDCLYIVDLTTGDTTYIGDLGPPGRFTTPTSMAVDLDGTLYTVNNQTGELLTLDKLTGAATVVGPGTGQQDGMAIAPVDVLGPGGVTLPKGTLFGSTSILVTIDKLTGDTTAIGPIGRRIAGLAFRSDGTLFGAELSLGTDTLVTISTETGAETIIGEIGPNFDRIGALVFTVDDVLLGSDINTADKKIFEIDQASAAISNELTTASSPQGMGFGSGIDCISFDELDQTIADASIDNQGVRNSLQAKANNARKQFEKGHLWTAGNVLCALLHEVEAQSGNHIDPASAQDIMACVSTLAANLGISLPCESISYVFSSLEGSSPGSFESAPRTDFQIEDGGIAPSCPESFALHQNSPNPFRSNTTISFSLPDMTHVILTVHDITGRTVVTLVDGELAAGAHTIEWDANVRSGMYLYRIQAGHFTTARRMAIVR